jgi:hypothetical protein
VGDVDVAMEVKRDAKQKDKNSLHRNKPSGALNQTQAHTHNPCHEGAAMQRATWLNAKGAAMTWGQSGIQ